MNVTHNDYEANAWCYKGPKNIGESGLPQFLREQLLEFTANQRHIELRLVGRTVAVPYDHYLVIDEFDRARVYPSRAEFEREFSFVGG